MKSAPGFVTILKKGENAGDPQTTVEGYPKHPRWQFELVMSTDPNATTPPAPPVPPTPPDKVETDCMMIRVLKAELKLVDAFDDAFTPLDGPVFTRGATATDASHSITDLKVHIGDISPAGDNTADNNIKITVTGAPNPKEDADFRSMEWVVSTAMYGFNKATVEAAIKNAILLGDNGTDYANAAIYTILISLQDPNPPTGVNVTQGVWARRRMPGDRLQSGAACAIDN